MKTVLIVDDETDICDVLSRVFDRLGFATLSAPDGATGLSLFDAHHPDLVLTDMIMPQTDGLELIREIRARNADVKIIAISGGGNTGAFSYRPDTINTTAFLEAASQAGADLTLTKPFSQREVKDAAEYLGLLG